MAVHKTCIGVVDHGDGYVMTDLFWGSAKGDDAAAGNWVKPHIAKACEDMLPGSADVDFELTTEGNTVTITAPAIVVTRARLVRDTIERVLCFALGCDQVLLWLESKPEDNDA